MSKIIPIHTSDRILFKRCRRKWNWQSLIKEGLQPNQSPSPLWFGSGFHYALEDFHGFNKHGGVIPAFDAYVTAYRKASGKRLPYDWEELVELGHDMFGYYTAWLINRDPLKTFIHKGQPQVEVHFEIPLNISQEWLDYCNAFLAEEEKIAGAVYRGSIDRVTIDEDGLLWLVDYKTAKSFVTSHLETDPQISAYCWAASKIYPEYTVGGFIYQQHKKTSVEAPRLLASGKLSTAKTQSTSRIAYRSALINIYGSPDKFPKDMMDYLNWLTSQETTEADMYIRRDRSHRNAQQIASEEVKIIQEAHEMINPNLLLYPNPTRDCSWECSTYYGACIALDGGYDWEQELRNETITMQERDESWRKYL